MHVIAFLKCPGQNFELHMSRTATGGVNGSSGWPKIAKLEITKGLGSAASREKVYHSVHFSLKFW